MENWLILSKLSVLAYCILVYADHEMLNADAVVLFILLYVCLNTGLYIVKKASMKIGLLVVSVVLVVGCFMYLNPLFILLLPINIYELMFLLTTNLWVPLLMAAIPLLAMNSARVSVYILVGSFSYLVFTLGSKLDKRIHTLTRVNDDLRVKVTLLDRQLNKDLDYERQLNYSKQLEVRNSIAQEIHDRVGHSIAGSIIQLEAAGMLIERDQNKTQEIILNVIAVLRKGMENIRETLRNIKPPFEQLGINRIKLLLDEFALNNQIKTSLVHSGNLEHITPIQWKVISDNLGESLTNALKYSEATAISIKIEVFNKFIKSEVSDNGIGTYTVIKGLGIRGMEERSGRLGGKVVIDGSRGFSVITLLPLEED